MFRRRTLFVVGAGASHEVGFPVGNELAKKIGEKLKPTVNTPYGNTTLKDEIILDQLVRQYGNHISAYVKAAWTISNGIPLANSIDDFLNIHSANSALVELGKAAIVRAIIQAERSCDLFVDPSNIYNKMNFNRIRDTWLLKFMRVLRPGNSPQNIETAFENVAFVVFNYDRCLEYFLTHAIHDLFDTPLQDAAAVVRGITILHPYGKVGELDRVPFGNDGLDSVQLFEIAKRIKTYTEQMEDEDALRQIRKEVERADCIVYLGFSYLEQNMALLMPHQPIERKPVLGTAFGLSETARNDVVRQMSSLFTSHVVGGSDPDIELNTEMTCSELFDHYARSLTASRQFS